MPKQLYCTMCNGAITLHYVMCDVIEGQWHPECFNFKRCEEKHGEGCATHVYESPK